LTRHLEITAPCSSRLFRQFGFAQELSQVASRADSYIVRRQAGKRNAIFEEYKGYVLIVSAVDAIGEIACCLRDADKAFFQKIRSSDFLQSVQLP